MAELFVYFFPSGWWELFVVTFIFQFFLILFSNLVVIVTFLWDNRMKTSTNIYIFSLSVADILMSACAAVYARMLFFTPEQYEKDESVCKWTNIWFIAGFNFISGIFTMIAIAADRYRRVMQPSKGKFSRKYLVISLSLIWFVAAGYLVLPYIMDAMFSIELPSSSGIRNETNLDIASPAYKLYNYSNEYIFYCSVAQNNEHALYFSIAIFAGIYVLPLIVMSFLYGRIIYRLSISSSDYQTKAKPVVRMMMTILVLFAFAYLPIFAVQMVRTAYLGKTTPEQDLRTGIALNLAYLLIFCNTWMNVVVYTFYNSAFRKCFWEMLNAWLVKITCKNYSSLDSDKNQENVPEQDTAVTSVSNSGYQLTNNYLEFNVI